jgi:predicted ATP-dependent endonuclease of OLD family
MLIHRIRIENYRSCKDIELYPGDVMALVGPNNAGKTNILAAINFVLGDRFPTRQGVALSDFYCQKEDRPISIEISFQENPDRIAKVHYLSGRRTRRLQGPLLARERRTRAVSFQRHSRKMRGGLPRRDPQF